MMINMMMIRMRLMISSWLKDSHRRRRRTSRLLQRVPHRVVYAADGVLNFADGLFGLPVALQLGVADDLANRFLRAPVTSLVEPAILFLSMAALSVCFVTNRDGAWICAARVSL